MLAMLAVIIASSLLALVATSSTTTENNVPCKPFGSLYVNGEDLCNTMFGESFMYVPHTDVESYDLAYTMWFFSDNNPNDATTQRRINKGLQPYTDTSVCWLASNETSHKPRPSPEGPSFTECYPYRQNACCRESTVDNVTIMNNKYGPEYRWDVCGEMSSACERFMVQEACFYECDPNIGLFRQYPPMANGQTPKNESGLEWIVYKVPIQGDYCDAWWQACREDLFCAVGDGDVFQCSAYYEEHNPPPSSGDGGLPAGAIVGIVIGSVVIACLIAGVIGLIVRERRGRPVFGAIDMEDSRPLQKHDSQQPNQATVVEI